MPETENLDPSNPTVCFPSLPTKNREQKRWKEVRVISVVQTLQAWCAEDSLDLCFSLRGGLRGREEGQVRVLARGLVPLEERRHACRQQSQMCRQHGRLASLISRHPVRREARWHEISGRVSRKELLGGRRQHKWVWRHGCKLEALHAI